MAQFILKIDLGHNDPNAVSSRAELSEVLGGIAEWWMADNTPLKPSYNGVLHKANGNTVGSWQVK